MDQNRGISSVMLCELVKFTSESELVVVKDAMVGVIVRPINITMNAVITALPSIMPVPALFLGIVTLCGLR